MARRPNVIIFDVNETLSDMSPMAERFAQIGAPPWLAKLWFAGLLRDAFALTAVGASEPFARIAEEALRVSLHGLPLNRGTDEAVQYIIDGFGALRVHADIPDGIHALAALGIRLVTLSNGSASVAAELLERTGLRDSFERLLTVENAGIWKPAPGAYAYALQQCRVDPTDAMLVAVHAWDIDGASRAGLATAWLNRTDAPYPGYFKAADIQLGSMTDLAEQLSARRGHVGDHEPVVGDHP